MIWLIKKILIGILTGLVNGSSHTKCVLLNSRKCEIQPSFTNLHPNEYSQEFFYYSFSVKLDKCVGIYNTINNLSNNACVSNKLEDRNLSVFQHDFGNKWIENVKAYFLRM